MRDITIMSAPSVPDRYGTTHQSWNIAASITETPARGWLSVVSTSETIDGREVTTDVTRLFMGADSALTDHDRVKVDDTVYEVVGSVIPVWTPRGVHHTEATLTVWAG